MGKGWLRTAWVVLFAAPLGAQWAGQPSKPAAAAEAPTTRAIAVLEWTGDEGQPRASRLVPVAVTDGGTLQDGGIYLARPQPLALSYGVEYELQSGGMVLGFYDLTSADQQQGAWLGYGHWKAPAAEKPRLTDAQIGKLLAQEDDVESERPTLHRKAHPGEDPADKKKDEIAPGQPVPEDAADRPVLHKKSEDAADAPAGDKPVLHRRDEAKDDADQAGSDRPDSEAHRGYVDPNRPQLRRGPAEEHKAAAPAKLAGFPEEMRQTVAVSDSHSRPAHPWGFVWSDPEDALKMKAAMEDAARVALGWKPAPPPPAPAQKPGKGKKLAAAAPPPVEEPLPLRNEQFRVFELAYSGGATLVLSAEAELPATPNGAPVRKFVTLLGQPDFYGNLLVLQKYVAEAARLDEMPRRILIDAVDALADNRGELLFELRGKTQRQFALIRVVRGRAEELFVSGASEIGTESAP